MDVEDIFTIRQLIKIIDIATKLVNKAISVLKSIGINKTALVVFDRNTVGNSFWEKLGFTVRDDLIYRNLTMVDMIKIDT